MLCAGVHLFRPSIENSKGSALEVRNLSAHLPQHLLPVSLKGTGGQVEAACTLAPEVAGATVLQIAIH